MQMNDKTSITSWKLWEHLYPLDSAGAWFITDIYFYWFFYVLKSLVILKMNDTDFGDMMMNFTSSYLVLYF